MGKRKRRGRYSGRVTSTGLPDGFDSRLVEMFGEVVSRDLQSTFVDRPITLRVNRLKSDNTKVLEALEKLGARWRKVSWYPDALIIDGIRKRDLTESNLFNNGEIYLQSLASMFPSLVLDPKPGEKVFDLTAAPGSKTTQVAVMMGCRGELVANDSNRIRFFKLKANVEIQGVDPDFVRLRMEDGSRLCSEYDGYFDKVLLDAPCSAESRFRTNDPRSFGYWKESKVKDAASRQRKLLFSAWRTVKPGGILVYSTCTMSPEENEIQVGKFLAKSSNAEVVSINYPAIKRLPTIKSWRGKEIPATLSGTFRIFPSQDIESFFIAKIRKSEDRISEC